MNLRVACYFAVNIEEFSRSKYIFQRPVNSNKNSTRTRIISHSKRLRTMSFIQLALRTTSASKCLYTYADLRQRALAVVPQHLYHHQ